MDRIVAVPPGSYIFATSSYAAPSYSMPTYFIPSAVCTPATSPIPTPMTIIESNDRMEE
jgi:hypothetical protein